MLLKASAQSGVWTNFGPVARRLEETVGDLLALPSERAAVSCASGTVALHALVNLHGFLAGRPIALAVLAHEGVLHVLRREFETVMRHMGTPDLASIARDAVRKRSLRARPWILVVHRFMSPDELATPLGLLDHVQGDAVFERTAGVEKLALAQHGGIVRPHQLAQPHQRRVAQRFQDVVHCLYLCSSMPATYRLLAGDLQRLGQIIDFVFGVDTDLGI